MMKHGGSVKAAALLVVLAVVWTGLGAPLTGEEWTDVPTRLERTARQIPAQARRIMTCWLAFPHPGSRASGEALTSGMTLRVWLADRNAAAYLPLEEYVAGVVAAEMPAGYAPDALCCQAVAARTRAVWSCIAQGGNGCASHPGYDLCTDSACCQGYLTGAALRLRWGSEYPTLSGRIREAVAQTRGQVLTYGGLPIELLYHACAGGRTEDAAEVFSHAVPYLVSVDSPGEESSSTFRSQAVFTREEAADRLLAAFPDCGVTADSLPGALEMVSTTASGRVRQARVGSVTATGSQLRQALGLRSAMFTWEADDAGLTFHVRGYGHGVGMSQAGAQAMAVSGTAWPDILAHYYPGCCLARLP